MIQELASFNYLKVLWSGKVGTSLLLFSEEFVELFLCLCILCHEASKELSKLSFWTFHFHSRIYSFLATVLCELFWGNLLIFKKICLSAAEGSKILRIANTHSWCFGNFDSSRSRYKCSCTIEPIFVFFFNCCSRSCQILDLVNILITEFSFYERRILQNNEESFKITSLTLYLDHLRNLGYLMNSWMESNALEHTFKAFFGKNFCFINSYLGKKNKKFFYCISVNYASK